MLPVLECSRSLIHTTGMTHFLDKEHREFTAPLFLCKRVNDEASILLSAKCRIFIRFYFDSAKIIVLKYFYLFFCICPSWSQEPKIVLSYKKNLSCICLPLGLPKLGLWSYPMWQRVISAKLHPCDNVKIHKMLEWLNQNGLHHQFT